MQNFVLVNHLFATMPICTCMYLTVKTGFDHKQIIYIYVFSLVICWW